MGTEDEVRVEEPAVAEHVEADPDLKHDHEVVLKSTLDDLGLWATVKRFPKVSLSSSSTEDESS